MRSSRRPSAPRPWGPAVGGDYTAPTAAVANAAWTGDAGLTWHPGTGLGGYRSGSSWLAGGLRRVVAVGPSASEVSWDGGRAYAAFDTGSFDSVDCAPDGGCFASGEQDRLARLTVIR